MSIHKSLLIIFCLLISACSAKHQVKSQQLVEWTVSTLAPKYYSAYIDILLITSKKNKVGGEGWLQNLLSFLNIQTLGREEKDTIQVIQFKVLNCLD
ncbi:hypothetical protein A6E05_17410 [Aliivibrio sp. 1S165]|nr:hypothetical protein A6E05_17410 [Aliivibrio sp. 1S165]OCH26934.1 hypothetical protein A6E06_09945 [Aliivibrio sp. 1S175]